MCSRLVSVLVLGITLLHSLFLFWVYHPAFMPNGMSSSILDKGVQIIDSLGGGTFNTPPPFEVSAHTTVGVTRPAMV